jgi:hypothetical protein
VNRKGPNTDASLVRLFVHWLYMQDISEDYIPGHWLAILEREDGFDLEDAILILLIKAYVFADRFLAISFREEVSRALSVHIREYPIERTTRSLVVKYAFDHVPLERPILQCLVDDYCFFWFEDGYGLEDIQAQQEMPRSFYMRVTRRLSEIYRNSGVKVKNKRCYVDHALVQEKESCKLAHMIYDETRDFGRFPDLEDDED